MEGMKGLFFPRNFNSQQGKFQEVSKTENIPLWFGAGSDMPTDITSALSNDPFLNSHVYRHVTQ